MEGWNNSAAGSMKTGTLCGWCRGGRVPHMRMPDNSYLFDPVRIAAWMSDRAA
jgi:hypothetical protein